MGINLDIGSESSNLLLYFMTVIGEQLIVDLYVVSE
jgi:hypothetical protein